MSYEKKHKKVEIDPARLEPLRAGLHEQIQSIVLVIRESLGGQSTQATRIRLTATTQGASSGGDPQVATQVTCKVDFDDGSTACYEDPPGVCCPGPCPC